AFRQVGKMIGEETVLDAIDAKREAVRFRGGGDGVGAGLLLAVRIRSYGGDELAGGVGKGFFILKGKIEVVALGYLGYADFSRKTRGEELTCQGASRFSNGHCGPVGS